MQKYLQMGKRIPGHQGEHAGAMTEAITRLNLRKSKSNVVHSAVLPNKIASKRRDDSLLEQENGIQSAILHCKRSFNASRGMHLCRSFSLSSIFGGSFFPEKYKFIYLFIVMVKMATGQFGVDVKKLKVAAMVELG